MSNSCVSDEEFNEKYGSDKYDDYYGDSYFTDEGHEVMKKPCSKNKIIPVNVTRTNLTYYYDISLSRNDVDEVVWYNPRKFVGKYAKHKNPYRCNAFSLLRFIGRELPECPNLRDGLTRIVDVSRFVNPNNCSFPEIAGQTVWLQWAFLRDYTYISKSFLTGLESQETVGYQKFEHLPEIS